MPCNASQKENAGFEGAGDGCGDDSFLVAGAIGGLDFAAASFSAIVVPGFFDADMSPAKTPLVAGFCGATMTFALGAGADEVPLIVSFSLFATFCLAISALLRSACCTAS